jgi:hypothetical protein
MVNANRPPASLKVRCRQIADGDLDGLADLFKVGFGARRSRAFWRDVLARLQARAVPPDMPHYGYVLDNEGTPVGAILLIFTAGPDGAIRANVSSWYVDPAFRGYAQPLVSQALKLKTVTYLNVSAARHTWPILPAQGYQRYSNGIFVALPALARTREPRSRLVAADRTPDVPFAAFEQELLARHAGYGCVSFWCVTPERAFPFVFRARLVKGAIPCAQLIYCADVADVVRFAGRIGRFLALRGLPFVILDANGPIDGLIGRYFDETLPKFFRGPVRPRLGDLADTETALFGM